MLNKISYQLLGTLVLRGGLFIAFLVSVQYYSTIEIAALGLLLLIGNSFATCIAMPFGVECRNYIVKKRKIITKNSIYFILTMILMLLISVLFYNYLETIQIISIENYLINLFLVSVLLYLQQIVYGYELIKGNSYINLFVGGVWFSYIILFFPKEINEFVLYYNLMVFFQIFFIFILLFKNRVTFTKGKILLDFIVNHSVYSLFGLPVFLMAQLILEKKSSVEVMAKVVVLIQITNLVGFFNSQVVNLLYNRLVVVDRFSVLESIVKKFKIFNYILLAIFTLSYVFRDLIENFLKQDWFVFYFNMFVFCSTSFYWIYNEFLIGKNKIKIVKICNVTFGFIFLVILFFFYSLFDNANVYAYIFSLLISRILAIYMTKQAVKEYFHENTNG